LFEILEKIHFEKGYVKLCLNPGEPAHDVARAPATSARRTRAARARKGAGGPNSLRPVPSPLCSYD
jgi:hypothetical protein